MTSPACLTSFIEECAPVECHWRCALSVIDELLSQRGAVSGEETDLLLDLRWHLHGRKDADAALRIFCDLRRRMERRHYLALFRIRRWLENHLTAAVRICPAAEPRFVRVKLDNYCVEAIRRLCLCAALHSGTVMLAPRLEFTFRQTAPVQQETDVLTAAAAVAA